MRVTSRDEIFGCSPNLIFGAGSGGFVHEEGSSRREIFVLLCGSRSQELILRWCRILTLSLSSPQE